MLALTGTGPIFGKPEPEPELHWFLDRTDDFLSKSPDRTGESTVSMYRTGDFYRRFFCTGPVIGHQYSSITGTGGLFFSFYDRYWPVRSRLDRCPSINGNDQSGI